MSNESDQLQPRLTWTNAATVATALTPFVRLFAIGVALFALVFPLLGLVESWKRESQARTKEAERNEKNEVEDWQLIVVYCLIDDASTSADSTKTPGLSFEQITSRYLDEVQQKENWPEIPKTAITKDALRRVLVSLIQAGLVEKEYKGNYIAKRVIYQFAATRCGVRCDVKLAVMKMLQADGGMLTIDALRVKADQIVADADSSDVEFALSEMHSESIILIDEEKRVWLATQAPPEVKAGPIPEWMKRLIPPPPPADSSPPSEPADQQPKKAEKFNLRIGCGCGGPAPLGCNS